MWSKLLQNSISFLKKSWGMPQDPLAFSMLNQMSISKPGPQSLLLYATGLQISLNRKSILSYKFIIRALILSKSSFIIIPKLLHVCYIVNKWVIYVIEMKVLQIMPNSKISFTLHIVFEIYILELLILGLIINEILKNIFNNIFFAHKSFHLWQALIKKVLKGGGLLMVICTRREFCYFCWLEIRNTIRWKGMPLVNLENGSQFTKFNLAKICFWL